MGAKPRLVLKERDIPLDPSKNRFDCIHETAVARKPIQLADFWNGQAQYLTMSRNNTDADGGGRRDTARADGNDRSPKSRRGGAPHQRGAEKEAGGLGDAKLKG